MAKFEPPSFHLLSPPSLCTPPLTPQSTNPQVLIYVLTAICLGVVNVMVAMLARTVAPEALSTLTGATRCLFTLGFAVFPAAFVPMLLARTDMLHMKIMRSN